MPGKVTCPFAPCKARGQLGHFDGEADDSGGSSQAGTWLDRSESVGMLPPCLTAPGPVFVSPTVDLDHSQSEDVLDVVGMPPGAWELESDLYNATVSAFNLAACRAPAMIAVLLVSDCVLVALEVVGLVP